MRNKLVLLVMVWLVMLSGTAVFGAGSAEGSADEPVRLVAATYLAREHVFYQALELFATKLNEYYQGPLEISLHHSGDLGSATDFFDFMTQGISVDVAFVAPSHMVTWVRTAQFLDTPYLFANYAHLERVYDSGALQGIEQNVLNAGVRVLGYAGGGVRNMILNKPVDSIDDFPGVLMRVLDAPIQARVFSALGVQPTTMAYLEVYNGIRTNVLNGLENEASALISQRFYEVAPHIVLTQHAITIRPMLVSEKRFQSFPTELQQAILRAGREAAEWARAEEHGADQSTLDRLQAEGRIVLHPVDTALLRRRAIPVIDSFSAELGVQDVFATIRTLESQ